MRRFEERWLFALAMTRGKAVLAQLIEADVEVQEAQSQVLRELKRTESVRLKGQWQEADGSWRANLAPIASTPD